MTIHAAKGLEFPTVFVVGLEENIFPSPMCTSSMRELEEERRLLYVAITRAERHCILTCAQNRFRYGRMEYDTPSRFIRDIDPTLIQVDDGNGVKRQAVDNKRQSFGHERKNAWLQNNRPVATQFRADPMPRAVAPRRPEPPADPFAPAFKRLMDAAGKRRLKPVSTAATSSALGLSSAPSSSASTGLYEGCMIEHQRFGVGKVISIEGTGDNEKATVEFRNAGVKQLLLKFAKYKCL